MFASVFGRTIGQLRAVTRKPILLSETGVGPHAGRFVKISNLFDDIRQAKALGLVWFDERQRGEPYRRDWRIEGDRLAEVAFRLGTSSLALTRISAWQVRGNASVDCRRADLR
jgi:mannan endo-1,4-beta-mannosidase